MQTPDSELRTRTVECFRIYEADRNLLPATPQLVRAGCAGGLPFDSLTTDLYAGCLPAREICYGNCFAARAAYSAGIDFGRRVANILDRATFVSDLKALPGGQKFLRNGWNSDPSWSWQNALKLARWIRESGRMTIFVTKSFASIDPQILRGLAAVGAELRVSVSAFDSAAQIRHRLNTIQSYREAGGCSIPLVMTTIFNRSELNLRQDQLVAHVLEHDLPAAENSLRFDPDSPVLAMLDRTRLRQLASSKDFWCGRIYTCELRVPTTTSLPPGYEGLQSNHLSKNDPEFLLSLFREPVHTHEEVLSGVPLDKPRQCGVPTALSRDAQQPSGRKNVTVPRPAGRVHDPH